MNKHSRQYWGWLLRSAQTSPFLPLLLISIAITSLLLFNTWELYEDRAALARLRSGQTPAYREAQRLQGQLEGMALGLNRLAIKGNPNAQLIVAALRSRGITDRFERQTTLARRLRSRRCPRACRCRAGRWAPESGRPRRRAARRVRPDTGRRTRASPAP